MINEYTRLAKSIESITHDQCREVVGAALDRLRQDVGAMIADLWVRTPGHGGIDILQPYLTRNDDQRPTPMPVSLTPDATGLLVWVSENLESVWIDQIDSDVVSKKSAVNRCSGKIIEGRYINLYDRTLGFAAVPVQYRSQLRGILTVETDQSNLIGEQHLSFMRAIAEPTGIVVWKAEFFEERKSQINGEISAFKVVSAKATLPLDSHRTGFIARPFGNEFKEIEEQVKRAFQTHRVRARSYLHPPGTGLVISEMMRQIGSAHFGLADITGMNDNVLIELGAMIASGKPFLILQNKLKSSATVPFDISGYQRYEYEVHDGSISVSDPSSKKPLVEFVQDFISEQLRTNSDFRVAKPA